MLKSDWPCECRSCYATRVESWGRVCCCLVELFCWLSFLKYAGGVGKCRRSIRGGNYAFVLLTHLSRGHVLFLFDIDVILPLARESHELYSITIR
jgi:hypothetical protein